MRAWPKETARTADPASLPEWLRVAPEDVPPMRDIRRFFATLLVCDFGPLALALVVVVALKPWLGALVSISLILGSALVSVFTIRAGVQIAPRQLEKEKRTRTLDALTERGEPILDGEVVGVAYAEGLWTYPHRGNRDADLGVVRLDFDRLGFVGGDTRFELPAAAIVGTEIRRHDWVDGTRARLYVHWREGDRSGTLSLGLPLDAPGRHVRATLALRERIEAWRREPFPRRTAPCELPPSVEPTAVMVSVPKTGRAAKVLAGLAMFVPFFIVMFMMEIVSSLLRTEILRASNVSFVAVILAPTFGPILAQKIEKRLPARWRHPEAEVSPLLAARTEDGEEEAVRVRG